MSGGDRPWLRSAAFWRAVAQFRAGRARRPEPPAPPPEPSAWASIHWFGKFIRVESHAVCGALTTRDPEGIGLTLPPDTGDDALGCAVRSALDASRLLRPDHPEFEAVFDVSGGAEAWAAWEAEMMRIAGATTPRTLRRVVKLVTAGRGHGGVLIRSTRHERASHFTGIRGLDPIRLPEAADDAALGAAVREGLARSL